jgi:hypothetical protein
MKNGIYKVKPFSKMYVELGLVEGWTMYMEEHCPKSRQIRIFNDKWNISGEEFPVCPEMFEDGPI